VGIELLVTIAVTGAVIIGELWEAAAVTFLFALGGALESLTLSRTRNALRELLALAPATATVLRDGRQVVVDPAEVATGELVLVKPGGQVPVDGEVVEGSAVVDESSITGESMPREKTPQDNVFAGTVVRDGTVTVRTTGTGADTVLARIIDRVEEAQEAKAPAQRFMERFARWYTPTVVLLAVLAFGISRDIELALTLLVIGCPGALVISIPVSVVAGIGRSAKRGILVKGGEHLERAGKITAVALDKTGTLTKGRPRLTDVVVLDPAFDQRGVLAIAAAAEATSEHPLARPVVTAAEELGIAVPASSADFQQHAGKGVSATVDGAPVAVGTASLLVDLGVPVGEPARKALAELTGSGRTGVLVAHEGRIIGLLGLADEVREDAAATVRGLRRAGTRRIVMLTGDQPTVANAVAESVGIDEVYAGLLPEDKLEQIRRLRAEAEVVAMVGDGVNDAPALATADVGIAMGAAGTDVAIETADIALLSDRLGRIVEAITLSRRTLNNLRQNVAIAVAVVIALLAGVLLGQVHMAGGMLVHEVSVLVVILNAVRLLRTRLPETDVAAGPPVDAGLAYRGPDSETGSGQEVSQEMSWKTAGASH
jgi:Zn2+/Cd2+-exporting ATPase